MKDNCKQMYFFRENIAKKYIIWYYDSESIKYEKK